MAGISSYFRGCRSAYSATSKQGQSFIGFLDEPSGRSTFGRLQGKKAERRSW